MRKALLMMLFFACAAGAHRDLAPHDPITLSADEQKFIVSKISDLPSSIRDPNDYTKFMSIRFHHDGSLRHDITYDVKNKNDAFGQEINLICHQSAPADAPLCTASKKDTYYASRILDKVYISPNFSETELIQLETLLRNFTWLQSEPCPSSQTGDFNKVTYYKNSTVERYEVTLEFISATESRTAITVDSDSKGNLFVEKVVVATYDPNIRRFRRTKHESMNDVKLGPLCTPTIIPEALAP